MADDGTALGDLLSGAAGRPVDRQGLNAVVQQGQALSGLRTAQTEDALMNAQRMREESDAGDQLETALGALTGPDGKPSMTPSQAHFTATQMKFVHGGAQPALEALGQLQKNNAFSTVANPDADPNARLASDQALNPGAQPFQDVGNQVIPRMAPLSQTNGATVEQTPFSTSVENKNNADAGLATAQANNPAAFHPSSVQIMDPTAVTMRGHMIAQGQAPMPTPYEWSKNPKNAAAVTQAALGENPNIIQSMQPQIAATIKDFAGAGKNGQALQGYHTVDAHLQMLSDAAAALNNGDVQGMNAVVNHVKTFFGSAAPTDANMLPQFIATEAMRALTRNNIGAVADRDDAQQKINVMNQGPAQQKEAISALNKILAAGKTSLEASYNSGTLGMAGKPGTPTFDQIYSGTVGQPAAPAAAPASGGASVLTYDPATGTFK